MGANSSQSDSTNQSMNQTSNCIWRDKADVIPWAETCGQIRPIIEEKDNAAAEVHHLEITSAKLHYHERTDEIYYVLGGLARHPKVGASFEGFALDAVARRLGALRHECFFWATHQGAELDLLVVRGSKRLGFEIKHTVAPEVTRSMRVALADLRLDRIDVIHVGKDTYPLADRIRAVAFERLEQDIHPLR